MTAPQIADTCSGKRLGCLISISIKSTAGLLPLLLLLFLLSLCFYGQKAYGADVADMLWLEDVQGNMTIEQVQQRKLDSQWQQSHTSQLNFGYTESTIWLNVPFENMRNTHASLLLEIAFPLHDHIDFYLLNTANEVIKTYRTGDQLPFIQRPLQHRNFLFPHTFAPGEKLRAIIRLQSSATMYIPVSLWEQGEFAIQDQHQQIFLGLLLGGIFIMLLYNLLIYTSTQQKNYLYYIIFASPLFYLNLTQKSLGFQYLWPESVFFNHVSFPMANFMVITTSFFLLLKFLELEKTHHNKITTILKSIMYLTLMGTLAAPLLILIDPSSSLYLKILKTSSVASAISTITALLILLKLAFKGIELARVLFVAWSCLLAGGLMFALGRMGLPLIPMVISENAILIGSAFEATLISIAASRHMKLERDKRIKAQEKALNHEHQTRTAQNQLILLQRKTTQQLEEKVKERTQKLEAAMKQLDNLSRLDSLTGLSNRRDFDEECHNIWLNGIRQHTPVSLLMIDIDFFKKINDTHGHLAGDQCLMQVAAMMKNCTRHTDSVLARFGGEEFIVLLPDTDTAGAIALAERIRQNTEQLQVNYKDATIGFTLSVGIATTIPTECSSCDELLANADQSVYFAKENGRNRVVALDNFTSKTSSSTGTPMLQQPAPTTHYTEPKSIA